MKPERRRGQRREREESAVKIGRRGERKKIKSTFSWFREEVTNKVEEKRGSIEKALKIIFLTIVKFYHNSNCLCFMNFLIFRL